MSNFKRVSVKDLQTHEEYCCHLLVALAACKTLAGYEMEGYRKGLFDADEEETSKTICWEVSRLVSLYRTQLTKIIERTGFDEEKAIADFVKILPEIPIPKRKETTDVAKDE